MLIKKEPGLTYDDVLLIPQRSFIDHRADVSLQTNLTKNIKLHIPLVSANMDTVTEAEMAIAMAREGGLGIIHRFMTIEEQVEEVIKVKRSEGFLVDKPYTVAPDMSLKKFLELREKLKIRSFLVTDTQNKLQGIITRRDYRFEDDLNKKVKEVMTPITQMTVARVGLTFHQAKQIFKQNKFEKIPLVDKNGILKGLITSRSVLNYEKHPFSTKDRFGRYRVGAAVGVTNDYLDRVEALVDAKVDLLLVDVAHGHNQIAQKAIKAIRKKYKDIDLIGGNVATVEGAENLIKERVDAIKVGVGPGGLCTTRMVAGVGVPQLTAVAECSVLAKKKNVPVIADGGTNYPGDLVKALAAGASTVMLAGWFAGTDESPGGLIMRKGLKYKVHRGSASFLATADRKMELENHSEERLNTIVAEGVEALVPYKGKVVDVIYQLVGAIRSGMSYCNAKTIPQLWRNARFIKITEAGFRESNSHNVEEI